MPSSRVNNSSRKTGNSDSVRHKKENKSVLIDLAHSVSHIYKGDSPKEEVVREKRKFKKYSEKTEEAISNNIKKNIIKNVTHSRLKPTDSINIPFKVLAPETNPNELSENEFQKLLYSAFAKTQGFSKTDTTLAVPHTPTGNSTTPNFTSFLSTSMIKHVGKKSNGYSNSLTQFMGRKQ